MNFIWMRRFSLFSLLLLLNTVPALAEDWVIAKVSGEAWIAVPNVSPVRAAAGMTVPDGATFSTRHNGRAQLERGLESILASPNTVISPRSTTFFGTSTTILQQTGQIELEVEKRNVKHFMVKTPLLAAVVKGTHFTVTASARSAEVQVSRGLVEVSDLRNGSSADIGAGQKATVGAQDPRGPQVSGAGNVPETKKGHQGSQDGGNVKGQPSGKGTGGASSGQGNGNSQGGPPGAGSNAGSNSNSAGNGKGGGASGDAAGGKGNSGGGKGDAGSSGSAGSGSSGNGNGGKGNGDNNPGSNGNGGTSGKGDFSGDSGGKGNNGSGKGGDNNSNDNDNGGGNSGNGNSGGKGKDR
jgi:hypothetical protein